MFVQFKEGIHDVFCSVECRLIQGTVIDIQHFRYFAEKILLGSSGSALILRDTDIRASFVETGGNAQLFLCQSAEITGALDSITNSHRKPPLLNNFV